MMNIEQEIRTLLADEIDPISGLNFQDLNLKSIISVDDKTIQVQLSSGFPCQFLQEKWMAGFESKLQSKWPGYDIEISIDHFIKSHRTQMAGKGLRGVKNTIAIASGKGGVGKSTVTVNLAIALARAGARVGILDADIYGPSIPLMLGEAKEVEVVNDQYLPVKAHNIEAMSIGYLTHGEQALIWRGPMLAKSLLQMLNITKWDELDYLLIDLPPGTGDIQLSLVQKIPLTSAIVVTTPQTVATLDAQKALHMFQKTNIDVLGIIENMSLHVCTQCGHEEPIFGQGGAKSISQAFDSPLLGQLPLHSQIGIDCDEGKPTTAQGFNPQATAFIKTALIAAIQLANKPLNYADKFPPIVTE